MKIPSSEWVFPKIRIPQNGWFIMETPFKMDDLEVPLFSETSELLRIELFFQKDCHTALGAREFVQISSSWS